MKGVSSTISFHPWLKVRSAEHLRQLAEGQGSCRVVELGKVGVGKVEGAVAFGNRHLVGVMEAYGIDAFGAVEFTGQEYLLRIVVGLVGDEGHARALLVAEMIDSGGCGVVAYFGVERDGGGQRAAVGV